MTARLLVRSRRVPAAERVLERSWAANPDPALAAAWMALAPVSDTAARLRQAERLHALDRDSAEGRLAVAEAELAAGRWAEARSHLTAFQGLVTRRYCRLMAYLESAAGNEAAAREWFEKSLSASADPGPAGARSLQRRSRFLNRSYRGKTMFQGSIHVSNVNRAPTV